MKLIFSLFPLLLLLPEKALAVCPVCTVSIGGGLWLSQKLGIDETIIGLWIGSIIVSAAMWMYNILQKRNISFPYLGVALIGIYYLGAIIALQIAGYIGTSPQPIFGLDRILFGMIIGSLVFILTINWYRYLKFKNHNHAFFPFQKIVMTLSNLLIFSLSFYIITH